MGVLQWRREYSTGVETYDAHHQALFAQANALYRMIESFKPDQEARVRAGFRTFADLVRAHARHEEELMVRNGHPGAQDHVLAHRAFLALVDAVIDRDQFGPEGHTAVLDALGRFRRHFEDEDEQGFLARLRKPGPPHLP